MDPQENYEFINKRKFQIKQCLQKDSKLDFLNLRVEDSCQSELDQIPTDFNPHNYNNNQSQQYSNIISQNGEQNQTIFLNENLNDTKNKSQSFKFVNHVNNQVQNDSINIMEQTDYENGQTRTNNQKMKNEQVLNNFKAASSKTKGFQQSKEFVLLSKIKSKMKKFFREKTYSGKSFNLKNPKLRMLINDKSDILQQRNKFFTKYCWLIEPFNNLVYQKINNKIPLFNPLSYLKFGLDIVFSVINCLFFFFSSILLIFEVNLEFEMEIYNTMYLIWIVQMIIKLNTSFYEKTHLIKNRKAIARFYLKEYALWDLLPFLLVFVHPSYQKASKFFKILQFVKLINVVKKLNDIQISICMLYQNYYIMQLVKLVLKIFVIAHIIACLWYLVGYIELEYLAEEQTWFDESIAANDRNWAKLYISSLYWSLTLMTTGSNEAHTVLQISFTSFTMLFTTIIFGYLLNIIGIILSEVDQEEENQRRDINQINQYMRKRFISKNLQREINLDLEYYYHHNFKKNDDQNEIVLSKISENLVLDLKKEYFGKLLKKIDIITEQFSQETSQKILYSIEEQNYLPGQVINNYQNYDDLRLVYIIQGKVELIRSCSDNSGIEFVIDSFGKDKLIGQVAFFSGIQDEMTYKVVDFTQVLSIPRNKFLEIVKQNDQDMQTFCNIRDKISFNYNFEDIKIKCQICNGLIHQQYDCPLLHLDKQSSKVKASYILNLKQRRQNYNRKYKYQCNSLLRQYQVEDACKLFNMSNNVQEFFVASPYFNHSASQLEGIAESENQIDNYNHNTKITRSMSLIKQEDEENKSISQELIKKKKKKKSIIKRKTSQQICLNVDSQLSNLLYDESNTSDNSMKERLQKETSIVSKLMEGSTAHAVQQNQSAQLNLQGFIKAITQQYLQKFSKLENFLKGFSGQQIILGKQANQNSQRGNNQNSNIDNNIIILDFDQRKDYTIYFPNGNLEKILFNYNQKLRRNAIKVLKRKKK
ncbi:hypothetical protein ABPG73_020944 [Tetrahymena malaccensis]